MLPKNDAIGGYFELELSQGSQYHSQAIQLNSGRHCLEYILRLRGYSKIWIPYYTCEVVLEPIKKLGCDYDFYHIDEMLEPIFDYDSLVDNEAFIYTNYFGIKDHYIRSLPTNSNIIIDNSMAFFAESTLGSDTFYSARKFFGVPDGAYLYTHDEAQLDMGFPISTSYQRFTHLLKRIDLGAEQGYADFKDNNAALSDQEIMIMSKLTERILSSIDYRFTESRRLKNYKLYQHHLGQYNMLADKLLNAVEHGPLIYPFLIDKPGLREHLISKKVFVAQYWPNVLKWCAEDSWEHAMTKELVALPIDQRYKEKNIMDIVRKVLGYAK